MRDIEIVERFLESGVNLHPRVLDEIKKSENVEETISRLLTIVRRSKPSVLTPELIHGEESHEEPPVVEVRRRRKRTEAEEHDSELVIRRGSDVTGRSLGQGNIESFVSYFSSRYERLSSILRSRKELREAQTVERVLSGAQREVSLIGMVSDIRTSRKGNLILELEDPTGSLPVIVLSEDRELMQAVREVTKDEVLGVVGFLSNGGNMLIAKEIFFPDLPHREPRRSESPVAVALISDVHAGSTKFMREVFLRFIRWLRGELGTRRQRELAGRVKYVFVGGDLVDGVGIYPEQKEELLVKDIQEQYALFARMLEKLPEHVEVVVLPGNHDAARQAEPQPAIEEEFAPELYENPGVHMVGNPCFARVHGVEVVSYHGRSLDDIIASIPGLSYTSPARAMQILLRKRHLSPIYGGRVPLAPELVDHLVLEEPPEILHMGHVHRTEVTSYRGTLVVNSGTFQEQTEFQRRMNIQPTPGRVPIVDLQSMRTTIMRFV